MKAWKAFEQLPLSSEEAGLWKEFVIELASLVRGNENGYKEHGGGITAVRAMQSGMYKSLPGKSKGINPKISNHRKIQPDQLIPFEENFGEF